MALNDFMPSCIQPCFGGRHDSLESAWLNYSDFGECFPGPPDTQSSPCLTPVYNGKLLDIHSEFVHASLSGISIKHYYGKCYLEEEEEEEEEGHYQGVYYEGEQMETFGSDLFDPYDDIFFQSSKTPPKMPSQDFRQESTDSGSFEYRSDSLVFGEVEQPICTRPKINFRNSFWNIHKPEMCKLTWAQKYVSAATVTEHLHEHLISHGVLCAGFHQREDREYMLNKELDEYVRLKELASPRDLPPDEKMFDFKMEGNFSRLLMNPLCKSIAKPPVSNRDRFLTLDDDEDVEERKIHRSKEEFCLTIGKHIRKPPILKSISAPEELLRCKLPHAEGEEADEGFFFYNWFLFQGEESDRRISSDKTPSEDEVDSQPTDNPCPPLGLDDFCRSVRKADFSDLRCNPDDF